MSQQKIVVGLGEILWDMLPTGARLGGAPANFTVMAARLGDRGIIASRLGADALGEQARAYLQTLPAETIFLQSDSQYATGTVTVSFAHGETEYEFQEPVAWDNLSMTPEWRVLAQSADAVCFGTLAQRSNTSRAAIQQFLAATRPDCVRIFDVNLRQSFYSADLVQASLSHATVLKLNETEVAKILALAANETNIAQDEASLHKAAQILLSRYPLKLVCISLGAEGSLLVTRESAHRHHGISIEVADTVGAGDAFTAALTHYYLQSAPLPVLNEAGNRWGAWVASQPGAMPYLSAETTVTITQAIEKAALSVS